MQRVQRKFGTLLKRSPDEQHAATVLHEFDDAEKMLGKLIDAFKAWRDAWAETLRMQLCLAEALETLYRPIGEHDPDARHIPAQTPGRFMLKSSKFRQAYAELKTDLINEVNMIDEKLVRAAMNAKEDIQPLKKTIKDRENKKLDYERYTSRTEAARKKETRTTREETALMKHELDLSRATTEYEDADEHVKRTLPPVTAAICALIPDLLVTQIMIQHTLVAQIYTVLHSYCEEQRIAENASMDQVVSTWASEFTPLQNEVEGGIRIIASGKAVQQPMAMVEKGSSITGLGIRNKITQHRGSIHIGSKPALSPPATSGA
ncbi:hypothetical protein LTR28_006779, partial [Elasticomyces elasticus]